MTMMMVTKYVVTAFVIVLVSEVAKSIVAQFV